MVVWQFPYMVIMTALTDGLVPLPPQAPPPHLSVRLHSDAVLHSISHQPPGLSTQSILGNGVPQKREHILIRLFN